MQNKWIFRLTVIGVFLCSYVIGGIISPLV